MITDFQSIASITYWMTRTYYIRSKDLDLPLLDKEKFMKTTQTQSTIGLPLNFNTFGVVFTFVRKKNSK
jgi:hypothetical protein